MFKPIIFLVCIFFVICPEGVFAQEEGGGKGESAFEKLFGQGPQEEDFFRADRLLVSATGSQVPVRLAPSVASVITSEEIAAMGASTLDDVLQTVPGLYAAPSGFNVFSSVWSIRGIRTDNNPHVLLLMNGVPMTQVQDGRREQTYRMPVHMISRVEVVRGPGSAVHGADAFAGTVNVITKDGHEVDGTKAGVRYGSFDTSDLWLQHGGQYGGWNMVGAIEARKSQGDNDRIVDRDRVGSAPPSLAPGALDTRSQQVDVHLGFNKEDRWVGKFYGSWIDDNAMGPGGAQAINYESTHTGRQLIADLSYHTDELAKDWDLTLQAIYFYNTTDNFFQFYPAAFSNMQGQPIGTTQTSTLETVGIYEGFNRHRLRFAAGLKATDTDTDEFKNFTFAPGLTIGNFVNFKDNPQLYMADQNRSLWHISLQDEWALVKGWDLTVGVRHDDYSDFGSTTNPRAALVWETTPELTSKLIYGRAFRPPAFNEMYINFNPSVVGNANIDPETIDTYELAFVWQPASGLSITPSTFYYKIDGLIEQGGTPNAYDNRRDQKGHGFEIDFQWQALANLEVSGNLANQRSEDDVTGAPTADTPEWQAFLSGNWAFLPDWSLNGQSFWIADRNRAAGDTRADIKDYELVNMTLRRTNIAKYWEAAVSVRNLFDENVREPSPYAAAAPSNAYIPNDYPMESRAIWAELSLKL